MERMGPRRAGEQNGDGTIDAGRTRTVAARAAAVTVAVIAAAALAGCSVTVQPKNAAASRPLSSSPSPTAVSHSAPSTSADATSSSSSSPSPTPSRGSDVDHTVCTNVRELLATLRSNLESDKDSVSRTAQDYRTAGSALRIQDSKTDDSDLKATLKAIGIDYQTVGRDLANHDSADADLAKASDASKPLNTLCGGGPNPSSSTASSTASGSSSGPGSSSSSST